MRFFEVKFMWFKENMTLLQIHVNASNKANAVKAACEEAARVGCNLRADRVRVEEIVMHMNGTDPRFEDAPKTEPKVKRESN